jgi:hypothetical protein
LRYNQTIVYRCAFSIGRAVPDQEREQGPYWSKVIDIGNTAVQVRKDGMHGREPRFLVFLSDIVEVLPG